MVVYCVEYIWQDVNSKFRSKVRYINCEKYSDVTIKAIPLWNFDGSSTGQATTADSEVVLKPIQLYEDKSNAKYYILCETYVYDNTNQLIPHKSNHRHGIQTLIDTSSADPWFGFEQEFFIRTLISSQTPGAPMELVAQGPYYCGVEPIEEQLYRSENAFALRKATEAIAKRCVDLDLGITGWNLEVAPGQTEIQIFGHGLKACDDLQMLRYLAYTTLAAQDMIPDFSCKPLGEAWNGSGLHTNYSDVFTRADGGYEQIVKYMEKFSARHKEHLAVYGKNNHLRLTGNHETSSMETFTFGVASRDTSVRIPRETFLKGCGYFEDRRPAADADPYDIARAFFTTIYK